MQKTKETKETKETTVESIWLKHWKDFYITLGSEMPGYYRFDYVSAKDYLISLFKYYFYLNNYYNLQTAEYKTIKNHSNEALNSIFVILHINGYPIARNLIVYAWISKWKEATDILSDDPEYKKIIPEYHAMQVDDKQFLSILCDCKTTDLVQLIKAYKPRHDIESNLNNVKHGREITPFLDLVWQKKPDFILEAFIIAGWDVNEHRHVNQHVEVTVLYKAFHAQKYKIVRLLLEAGANPKHYIWSQSDDTWDNHMPYFHSFITFAKLSRTTQDYIDFAIYAKYVIDRLLDNKDVKEIKYVQDALQWFERLKTFELIVLRSKKDSSNVFSVLNKDVISIIKGYLYVFNVKQN